MLRRSIALSVLASFLAAAGCASSDSTHDKRQAKPRTAAPDTRRPHVPRSRRRVPMLMYHLVEEPPAGAPYPALYVRARIFRAQLGWLERRHFQAVTLAQVQDAWRGRARLPRRAVVISFDDGYPSVYRHAFPALAKREWPGVLNLSVRNLDIRAGLSRAQVRRLLDAGWELASHTIRHSDLTTLPARQLRREVRGSRRILRRLFGAPVLNFAYPMGRYNRRVMKEVRAAGYRGAATIGPGLASRNQPFELRRVRMDEEEGLARLALALTALSR